MWRTRGYRQRRKKVHSYLPLYDVFCGIWRRFGGPHSAGYVLVYVRVASPLAQAASTQSQWRVGLEIASGWWCTRDNAPTAPRMSIRPNRTSMFVSHLVHTGLTWSHVTKIPLSGHSLYTFIWYLGFRGAGHALRHQHDGARDPHVIVIVVTRTSLTGSPLVRQLLHTIQYAAPPKLRLMPPKNVTLRKIGPVLVISLFDLADWVDV